MSYIVIDTSTPTRNHLPTHIHMHIDTTIKVKSTPIVKDSAGEDEYSGKWGRRELTTANHILPVKMGRKNRVELLCHKWGSNPTPLVIHSRRCNRLRHGLELTRALSVLHAYTTAHRYKIRIKNYPFFLPNAKQMLRPLSVCLLSYHIFSTPNHHKLKHIMNPNDAKSCARQE
jgi:hypothetical protein